ncbi:MAG: hypothetical protein PHG16_01590 [Lachnospiraceae bacterium]|nr:hypothetical protein [Lachnospiraceae bacterium]
MSKFLKIIVNICIICFLLTGVALIVPQLVGVTTVVVDDSVTESNVGIGSVVYAKKVELSDLGVGDKLLRSSNTSCYVSKITEADPKTGIYKVEGADGAESVTLRNTAEKTYIVVPAIGFVSIAMQSFEGRIILGLVLAVLVILYILSEIWKKNSEDAEEDLDTEENEQEEKSGKQKESQEDLQETEAASKNTESKTEEDSLQELETPQEEAPLELILEDVSQTQKTVTQNTATISEAELKELESAMTGDSVPEVEVEEEAFVESGEAAEIVEVETEEVEAPLEVPDKEEMDADVALEAPKTEEADLTPETVKTEENRVDLETKAKADSVGQETKAEADSADSETETQENSGKDDLKLTDVAEDSLEAAIIQAAAVAESEQAEALRAAETRPEVTFEPLPSEETVKQEEELEESKGLAMPSLTKEEILEKARAAGDEPNIIEDPELGVTLIDYSDILAKK